jgi:hypothetical protein
VPSSGTTGFEPAWRITASSWFYPGQHEKKCFFYLQLDPAYSRSRSQARSGRLIRPFTYHDLHNWRPDLSNNYENSLVDSTYAGSAWFSSTFCSAVSQARLVSSLFQGAKFSRTRPSENSIRLLETNISISEVRSRAKEHSRSLGRFLRQVSTN